MRKLFYRFHCMSIRNKLILSFTILVVVPIMTSLLFSYRIVNGILLNSVSAANVDSIDRTAKRIDTLLNDISYSLLNISTNQDLRDVMMSASPEDTEDAMKFNKYKRMELVMDKTPLSMLGFSYLTIISDVGDSYGNWDGFNTHIKEMKSTWWYNELIGSFSQKILWIGSDKNTSGANDKMTGSVVAAIPIKSSNNSIYSIGVLHIAVPETAFYNILKPEEGGQDFFLIDTEGNILSCSDRAKNHSKFIKYKELTDKGQDKKGWFISKGDTDSGKNVIIYSSIDKVDWKLVSIIPYDKMVEHIYKTRNFIITVNLVFIFSFVTVAVIISNSIGKPIVNLKNKMKIVEGGDFSQRVEVLFKDEIGELGRGFNNMIDRVGELMDFIKVQEQQKREAELEMLQAQINPHFLFNTLSSIRWIAASNNDTKAEEMVLALSNLLKMSISGGPDMISLRDEIINLRYYTDLMKMRKGADFELICSIHPDTAEAKIPRLLLQPIVENSIIHGFEGKKSGCIIEAISKLDEKNVTIIIKDNGNGMDKEIIRQILCGEDRKRSRDKLFNSIGIKNVNERIKLNFGDEYALKIDSIPNDGTETTITIPYCGEGEVLDKSNTY